jgi:Polyketide cyclase / dehydrase and lipid transport
MVKVYTSSVLDAPADKVWSEIRDFNGLPRWHPAIKDSYIEHRLPSDKVGCIRNFTLKAGGRIRERLLALSDFDYSVTYAILESSMGVANYVATLKLTPITDGDRTFAEWSAEFDCAPERAKELARSIGQDVFQGGFEALKIRLGGR